MRNGYQALLLDLDGTLIDIEVSFFMDTLLVSLAGHFARHMDLTTFRDGLFGAMGTIMERPRPDGETNADGFYRHFAASTGLDLQVARDSFEVYYREVFPTLDGHAAGAPGALRFMEAARAAGYRLALATNPVFPRPAAFERLRWGGIDPGFFHYISLMEETNSCKPQHEYFLEVAQRVGVEPGKCLMVGNDVQHDLPAGEVGMGTFLVDRKLVNRTGQKPAADGTGSLDDLAQLLGLP